MATRGCCCAVCPRSHRVQGWGLIRVCHLWQLRRLSVRSLCLLFVLAHVRALRCCSGVTLAMPFSAVLICSSGSGFALKERASRKGPAAHEPVRLSQHLANSTVCSWVVLAYVSHLHSSIGDFATPHPAQSCKINAYPTSQPGCAHTLTH